MPKELLTVAETASMLRLRKARVWALARNDELPGVVRIGRRPQIRVDRDKLEEFIRAGGQPLPPDAPQES